LGFYGVTLRGRRFSRKAEGEEIFGVKNIRARIFRAHEDEDYRKNKQAARRGRTNIFGSGGRALVN
jgi:hypothetical protein